MRNMRVLPENACPAFYTDTQRAFVEAWFSLTDSQSLDTHRARTLNACLVLQELAVVCHLVEDGIISPLHRREVAVEAAEILDQDPVYRQLLPNDYRVLKRMLGDPNWSGGKNAARGTALRLALEDAAGRVEAVYLDAIKQTLSATLEQAKPIANVVALTNALASDLMANDFTIGNLHGFHALFLRSNLGHNGQPRSFEVVFEYLLDWLRRPYTDHEVVLKLSRADKLSTVQSFGGWQFNAAIIQKNTADWYETNFVRPGRSVIFATRTVKARDHRQAGLQALVSWRDTADLLSFDFLQDRVALSSRYRSTRLSDGRVDLGLVAEQIPNPVERSSVEHLRQFSHDVDETLERSQLDDDDKRQILAAFRYYRLGVESGSMEATFVTWWIAIESFCEERILNNPFKVSQRPLLTLWLLPILTV
jgi:hypothetical protein